MTEVHEWNDTENKEKRCRKRKMQYCESQVTLLTKSRCLVEWVEKYLAGRETSPNFPTTTTCHNSTTGSFSLRAVFVPVRTFSFFIYIYFFTNEAHNSLKSALCCVCLLHFFFQFLPFCCFLRKQDSVYSRTYQPEAACPHR